MNNARNIKHLYARAGFGIRFEDLHDHENWSANKAVRKLFKASADSHPITILTENIDLRPQANKTDEEKIRIQEERNTQDKALNLAWITQLSTTDAQLREKMTLFWHNHFACNIGNAYYEQQLNNIERENALGNFKTLLLQVSQSPGMLQFLNNQQNQKGHPNENFARELMELFTIGRGNYTEHDVKESARAFTGWAYDGKTGDYIFRPKVHDDNPKTFMGQTGNFCGEDIVEIIFSHKKTAEFISTKLYRYLVNDVPDAEHISQMTNVFYKSNYEIKPLLEFVFQSNWFYDDKNIGNLVKSPVEFLTGLNRQFYITYQNPDVLMQFQRTLGQLLFRPPNVAGWPGGKSWIDSSSLMYRMKMSSIILNAGVIDFTGKVDPGDEAYLASVRKQQMNVIKRVQAQPNWDKFLKEIPDDTSKIQIAEFMLEPKLNQAVIAEVNQATDIKDTIIQIVSTPEYQLC
ncbi:DUF1800 domain-containing protein [Mucilaginibacter sp. X5P1]|uniref:DUF1800 domain-containing protein n=1 Tax=Mucilaginibacter sp. X5P1 TaxID=2723088 RepID=UPI00161A782F|nr:DUF1800 domain-containing protein [Mucilaginibacter sp. X5P1]MBB6139127.1 uncharacterized protein (DUF1800 family) [Mucilaginibacter sp. X5P1]